MPDYSIRLLLRTIINLLKMLIRLKSPPHYDLLNSIHSWVFPDIQPVPEITQDIFFSRIVTINGEQVPLLIQQQRPNSDLLIKYKSDLISARQVKEKIRHILSLDLDMSSAHDVIRHDTKLAVIDEKIMGVRPYLSDTTFEALIKSVLQQQISYRAANMLTKRLVLSANIKDVILKDEIYQFPPASTILSMGPERLKELGLGYKVDYVIGLSQLICSGDLDLESFKGQSYSEIREILLPIRGIGEWTIQATAIAGLGDFSVFPYSDLGIRNLLGRLYDRRERMPATEVQRLADEWGEEGTLVLYLLMCADVLDLIPASRHRDQKTHKRKQ